MKCIDTFTSKMIERGVRYALNYGSREIEPTLSWLKSNMAFLPDEATWTIIELLKEYSTEEYNPQGLVRMVDAFLEEIGE